VCSDMGLTPVAVHKADDVIKKVSADPDRYSLLILDYDFGRRQKNGLEIFQEVVLLAPRLPVVFLTGQATISIAVEAMKLGAMDFIEKDTHLEDNLEIALKKVEKLLAMITENRELKEENASLKSEIDFYHNEFYKKYALIGRSPALNEVISTVERVAPIPRPILITGERGTGKELIAVAIHKASSRKNGPFVTVNCGGLSEGLLECELFGQEENAYPNAPFRRGRFELAHRGTLFLDEIGNMPLPFQQTVLRIIEYQKFERVGGSQTVVTDVRIIAATNSDLERAIREGSFRADLHDRLAFEILDLPPLRRRLEDIEPLCNHFLNLIALEVPGIKPRSFSTAALERLSTYDWPGNVRELKFFVERLAYRVARDQIGIEDLPALKNRDHESVDDPGDTRSSPAPSKKRGPGLG